MQYRLKLEVEVHKTIEALPGHIRQRVKRLLDSLRLDPRPANAIEMRGDLVGHYRIKFDQWRIVYKIDDDVLLIEVLKIGTKHGPEFYEEIG